MSDEQENEPTNVVPFASRDVERDAIVAKLNRLLLLIRWAAEMRKAGRMPDDVAQVFDEYFGT